MPYVDKMLTHIHKLWPPKPSEQQIETGTKTLHTRLGSEVCESLADLHEPAWWSGVRIWANRPSDLQITLTKGDDSPVFDLAPETCTWVQASGEVRMLPWAIPAAMGSALNMKMKVSRAIPSDDDLFIVVTTYFHELPHMLPRDRYLYISENGTVIQYWDGKKRKDGTQERGVQPTWRTLHYVVPPTYMLGNWDDHAVFCFHDWSERLSLRQDSEGKITHTMKCQS